MTVCYRVEVTASCDNEDCPKHTDEEVLDRTNLPGRKRVAKRDLLNVLGAWGWKIDGNRSWCPDCAKKL